MELPSWSQLFPTLVFMITFLPVNSSAWYKIGLLTESKDDPTLGLARNISAEIRDVDVEIRGLYKIFNNSYDDVLLAFHRLDDSQISAIMGTYQQSYAVVSENLGIPYIVTSWVPEEDHTPQLIQMYPDVKTFESAVADLVAYFSWPRVAVMYDGVEGPYILERLLLRQTIDVRGYKVFLTDLFDKDNVIRRSLIDMRERRFSEIVVVSSPDTTYAVLQQALYLSLLSPKNRWIVVNMGTREVNLTGFVDTHADITALSLNRDEQHNSSFCSLGLAESVLHDAIHVFAAMARGHALAYENSKPLPERALYEHLLHHLSSTGIDMVDVDGCTGALALQQNGTREHYFLQLYTLDSLRKGSTGTWMSGGENVDKRIDFNRTYSSARARQFNNVFGDGIVRVTTKIEPPFVQWKKGHENTTKDKADIQYDLEGYCIDILNELAQRYDFRFIIYLVPDGKFGSLKPPPRGWTGMIRQLKDKKADVAMAPFSITPERSQVADFTKPFMIKGTSTIIKNPDRHVSVFQFLAPLSRVVWIGIFISFVGVSLVLFGLSRINCDRRPKTSDNLRESWWYIWATLLRGGTSGAPKATSSRTVSSSWWFFSLIIIAIYTANLAAFLTVTIVNLPINSAADLADQKVYDYGTVDGSQIEYFFKHTKISAYSKMYAYMSTFSPESMVRRVENGLDRVRNEKYAFLWDSPTLRYMIQSDCDLMEIGTTFDNKGYGWGVQKDAPYNDILSLGMLKLNDEGKLRIFEKKWWGRSGCPDGQQTATTESLEFKNVLGIFLVLAGGVVLSAILCLFNYLMKRANQKSKKKSYHEDEDSIPQKMFSKPIYSNDTQYVGNSHNNQTVL